MKQKLHYLIILLCVSHYVLGQHFNVVPPTPETASLFKSVDIPVSAYTGLPGVEVAFYTIQLRELQIPIYLSYNTRGIQVAEIGSRYGLGWALHAGGSITRQTRGLPDESPRGLLNSKYYNAAFTDITVRNDMHNDIAAFHIDEHPDVFYFNLINESGKFFFDHNDRKTVLQKYSDIKISPLFSNGSVRLAGWIVVDRLGNTYYFGESKDGSRKAIDTRQNLNNYKFSNLTGMALLNTEEQERLTCSWHLMEIVTYYNEVIQFFYEAETLLNFNRDFDRIENNEQLSFFSESRSIQHQI